MDNKKKRDDKYWEEKLTPEKYRTLRQSGTEPPFSGEYLDNKEKGIYRCAACKQKLFSSDAKYKSGTGWPSFWQALNTESIKLQEDLSHGMKRIEYV